MIGHRQWLSGRKAGWREAGCIGLGMVWRLGPVPLENGDFRTAGLRCRASDSLIYSNPDLKPTDHACDRIPWVWTQYLWNSSPILPILPLDDFIAEVILFALGRPFPSFLDARYFGK